MDSGSLSEPLNPKPSLQRQSSIEQIGTIAQVGNRLTVFLSSTAIALGLIIIGLMILREDPQCDTNLVLWLQCFLCMEVGFVLLLSVAICTGKVTTSVVCFMCSLGLAWLVLVVIGNFPLYQSKQCDEALWTFVFVIMLLSYMFLGLVCCFCCCFCCLGAAVLKWLEHAEESKNQEETQEAPKSNA